MECVYPRNQKLAFPSLSERQTYTFSLGIENKIILLIDIKPV